MKRLGARKVGFTLVELLVVVAIIAILISIIMPSIGNALSSGRRIACATNLRTLVMATREFADSRGGALPPVRDGGWSGPGETWPVFLSAYVGWEITKSADNLQVPLYQRICPSWKGRPDIKPQGRPTKIGHGMNPYVNGFGKSGAGNWAVGAVTMDSIRAPSTALLFGDSVDWHMSLSGYNWWLTDTNMYGYYSAHPNRHEGRANYGMPDGHVETLEINEAFGRFLNPLP